MSAIRGIILILTASLAAMTNCWADGAGWYLLIPPISNYDKSAEYLSGFKVMNSEPFSKWKQQSAFDTAAECESTKNDILITNHKYYSGASTDYASSIGKTKDSALLAHSRWVAELANANVSADMGALCVKSDDPRLLK